MTAFIITPDVSCQDAGPEVLTTLVVQMGTAHRSKVYEDAATQVDECTSNPCHRRCLHSQTARRPQRRLEHALQLCLLLTKPASAHNLDYAQRRAAGNRVLMLKAGRSLCRARSACKS